MGVAGGPYSRDFTTPKVLQLGFWWPTLLKYATLFVGGCDECQRFVRPQRKDMMPVHLVKSVSSL